MARWLQRMGVALLSVVLAVSAYAVVKSRDFQLPGGGVPAEKRTWTPRVQRAPLAFGSVDVLGRVYRSHENREELSAFRGGVEITRELVAEGRETFYDETFGNEVFLTDVAGVLDGPLNVWSLTRALVLLAGRGTHNLEISLSRDWVIGGRTFPKGSRLPTGIDVPRGRWAPLGLQMRFNRGRVQLGITCAACHSTVDSEGRIIEGAPNANLNAGLLLAVASNSAAYFRHTDVKPLTFPKGTHSYRRTDESRGMLPDGKALEEAVDAALLRWPPGSFDATPDLQNNPVQIPTSFTFGAWPYGWSGFASIGWFQGLTSVATNVHPTVVDPTMGAESSEALLGLEKEMYLGLLFQRAAHPDMKLPADERPSIHVSLVDPTPGVPGMNETVPMPEYPQGSRFALEGLFASSPRLPFARQLNAMAAWQNTLAPPPMPSSDRAELGRGAQVFTRAGCERCHSGRYFTSNTVIPQHEVGTEPSRARALMSFPRIFADPQTYPPTASVPVSDTSQVLSVPEELTPYEIRARAFAQQEAGGGYKVPSLIGLAVSAPYLHDGGVALSADSVELREGRFKVQGAVGVGLTGTLQVGESVDAGASLRALIDRQLRSEVIRRNRESDDLAGAHVVGTGHDFWVDPESGFSVEEQSALIAWLLSLDDAPEVLPSSAAAMPASMR
jgi:hypothetical protein